MRFRLNGRDFELDEALIRTALASSVPEPIRDHWVEIAGQQWPPKQVLEAAIGVHRAEFTSHIALRQLRRAGYETSAMPTDSTIKRSAANEAPSASANSPLDESPSPELAGDNNDAGAAFQTLLTFTSSGNLTERVARLESELQGADRSVAEDLVEAFDINDELLRAALLIRRHFGRINDIIHAAAITQVLPLILDEGERLTARPSLAAGNDPSRPFDIETDRRVAEFKIQLWKGTDAMRKRGTFQDLAHLALDQSGRRAQLFVAGAHAINFLRTSTSTAEWALDRASLRLRERFQAQYGSLHVKICDFTNGDAAHVDLVDLTELLPSLREN